MKMTPYIIVEDLFASARGFHHTPDKRLNESHKSTGSPLSFGYCSDMVFAKKGSMSFSFKLLQMGLYDWPDGRVKTLGILTLFCYLFTHFF